MLVVILLSSLAINTAVSYFKDSAFASHTMTVGNVHVSQYEMYRDGDGLGNWSTFLDPEMPTLLPVVGDTTPVATEIPGLGVYDMVNAANVLDKIVCVENTGNEAAFLRTLFAFEMLPVTDEIGNVVGWLDPVADGQVVPVYNRNAGTWECTGYSFIKNDVYYMVYAYTYTGQLQAAPNPEGEMTATEPNTAPTTDTATMPANISAPSLLQVYLAHTVGNEFYQAIGTAYEILILSQAVQTTELANAKEAFQTAFPYGQDGANVAKWFGADRNPEK